MATPRGSAKWTEEDDHEGGGVLDENSEEEDFVELEFDEADAEECCENSVVKPVCIPIAILSLILLLFFIIPLFLRHSTTVLLLEDVDGIGHCGEVVEVNAKLAHETLIPLGKAQEATAALDSTAPPGMEHHRENETALDSRTNCRPG